MQPAKLRLVAQTVPLWCMACRQRYLPLRKATKKLFTGPALCESMLPNLQHQVPLP